MPRQQSGRTRRAAILGAAAAMSAGATRAAASHRRLAFVGTYTPNGGGIHRFWFDPSSGQLTPIGVTGEVQSPSWLCLDLVRRRLFAVSEIGERAKGTAGAVVSYAIGADGALTKLGSVSSGGAQPAHASLHPSGRFVFVANYDGGSIAVIPVAADGALQDASDVQIAAPAQALAPALNAAGNFAVSDHARPHMHMVACDKAGRFVLATDAGANRIYAWRFDLDAGRLIPAATPVVAAPVGSAPRHFVFHPSGGLVYVLGEHDSRIGRYRYEPDTGALSYIDATPTLPNGFAGSSLGSEIAISPDGRRLYAANRLRDTVTSFAIDRSGALGRLGEAWVEGDYPRGFGLTPGWLVACNQRSDSLTAFRLRDGGRRLAFNGQFTPVGSPACIVFL